MIGVLQQMQCCTRAQPFDHLANETHLREIITRSLAPKYAPALPRGEVSRPA